MKSKLIFSSLFIVVLMFGFAAAYTLNYIHSPFEIPEGAEIVRNTFDAVNLSPETSVYLNGIYQGIVGEIEELDNNDFEARFEGWWYWSTWEGTNHLTFDKEVNNSEFDLDLTLVDYISGTGDWCKDDNRCDSGLECVERHCCGEDYPIDFSITSSKSCASSSIAVHPFTYCSESVPSSTTIDFYLKNAGGDYKLRDNCFFEGDEGWYIIGVGAQCYVNVPADFLVGTYELRAEYTLEREDGSSSETYSRVIESNFEVETVCSTSTTCSHGFFVDDTVNLNMYYSEGKLDETAEVDYIIPINADVGVKGISTFNIHCSNGVQSGGRPGVLIWAQGSEASFQGDNSLFNGYCELGSSRQTYIGSLSDDSGHLPDSVGGTCDIGSWTGGRLDKAEMGSINVAGDYVFYADYINAYCDSPDYVCRDLWLGGRLGTAGQGCRVGTMGATSAADGFKNLLTYNLKVVEPILELVEEPSYFREGLEIRQQIKVKNVGVGDIEIDNSSVPDLIDLNYSFESIPLVTEDEEREFYATFKIKEALEAHRKNIITAYGTDYLISEFDYAEFNLIEYKSYEFNDNGDLIVYYDMLNPLYYDDAYDFATISPRPLTENATFNFTFLCDLENHYAINLNEVSYYCLSDTYWANADWINITESELFDTVKLIYTNSRLTPGTEVVFEIYDEEGDSDVGIRTEALGNELRGIVDDGGNVYTYWTIEREDLERADDLDNFYFTVDGTESGYLEVSEDYDDDPMVVTLESPFCGESFMKGYSSEIVINVSDADDFITGNISIDGSVIDITNGVITIPYTWTRSGNLQIESYAENSRGYRRRTITSVMVIDPDVAADYVAACIDKPSDFSDITSSNVVFDASNSTGLRCSGGGGDGNCGDPIGPGGLWFSWRFSDGLVNFNHDGSKELAYKFHKNFMTAGHNWAELDVELQ